MTRYPLTIDETVDYMLGIALMPSVTTPAVIGNAGDRAGVDFSALTPSGGTTDIILRSLTLFLNSTAILDDKISKILDDGTTEGWYEDRHFYVDTRAQSSGAPNYWELPHPIKLPRASLWLRLFGSQAALGVLRIKNSLYVNKAIRPNNSSLAALAPNFFSSKVILGPSLHQDLAGAPAAISLPLTTTETDELKIDLGSSQTLQAIGLYLLLSTGGTTPTRHTWRIYTSPDDVTYTVRATVTYPAGAISKSYIESVGTTLAALAARYLKVSFQNVVAPGSAPTFQSLKWFAWA